MTQQTTQRRQKPYRNPLEHVVSELLETSRRLTEAIIALTVERDRLSHQLPTVQISEMPDLQLDEDVEDKLWEHNHGMIDKREFEAFLRQAGLSNTEIDVIQTG